jgi:autotransporter-associated beta strand protein
VTLDAGGGTFEVTHPQEVALLQVDDATARNIITGSGNLTKTGQGALRLGPGNTYTGRTFVLEGTLQFPVDSALGNNLGFREDALQIQNGAMIQSTGAGVLSEDRGIRLLGGIGTLSNLNAQAMFNTSSGALVINAPITGPGAMKKVGGAGALTLNSPNDFIGNLIIEAGRVNLNTFDAAGSGLIVVRPLDAITIGKQGLDDTQLFNQVDLQAGSTITIDTEAGAGSLIFNGDIPKIL